MTKPISAKQLAANRRNAKKSTGPRTPAGKRRSSRNSLKHGFLARHVLVSGGDGAEAHAEFDRLLADLFAELRPQGIIEEALVERIATCYWRLGRAQRYEVGAIRASLDECQRPLDNPDLRRLERKLARAQTRLEEQRQHCGFLEELSATSDSKALEALRPDLEGAARDFNLDCAAPSKSPTLSTPQLLARVLDFQRRVVRQEQQQVDTLEAAVQSERRYHQLAVSRRPLQCALPAHDTLVRLVRYESMLDRELHRALRELHRLRTPAPPPS